MRWQNQRRSRNVDNRRGRTAGGSMGIGLIFLLLRFIFTKFGIFGIVVLAGGYFALRSMGIDPMVLVSSVTGAGPQQATSSGEAPTSPYDDMVAAVLGGTEDVWDRIFAEEGLNGGVYPHTTLILYSGAINTDACGFAQSAVGPFYCPADNQIYIDTSFFDQLKTQFGSAGDFPPAYVIAHEVGHHVQTVVGISDQVRAAQGRGNQIEQNQLQVRMELQADCFAGLWAHEWREALEPGDIEEALRAAAAIGDDALSRQAGRTVNPDNFTHGSSAQRQRWFTIGYDTGSYRQCDTFAVDASAL